MPRPVRPHPVRPHLLEPRPVDPRPGDPAHRPPRVQVIGESLIDVVTTPDGRTSEHPGGSPLNVAVGLARLGHPVELVTRTGRDPRGDRLRAHLADAGVAVAGTGDERPTSVARAVLDAHGKAEYEFDLEWRLPAVTRPPSVEVLHTGSIGAALAPGAAAVHQALRAAHGEVVISYDPNVRPVFFASRAEALAHVEEFVFVSDVVKVSDDDLAWLSPREDFITVARRWQASGPALVVVTRGARGAFAVAAGCTVTIPAPTVDVVDTVGAGDAFASGLLHALGTADLWGPAGRERLRRIDGATLSPLLATAVRSASLTCRRAGAVPPTPAELHADVTISG